MGRGGSRIRPERVAEQIRVEMGEILQRELKDPRLGLVTCTRVEVSGDLKVAKIYVSVLAGPGEQKRALEGLEAASGFVRRLLGQRLRLRSSPEVRFVFDRSIEYGIELERLLAEAKRGSKDPGSSPERGTEEGTAADPADEGE